MPVTNDEDGGFIPIPDITRADLYDPATGTFSSVAEGIAPAPPPDISSVPSPETQSKISIGDDSSATSTLPQFKKKKTPPDLKTLVYAPDVRIIIARGNRQYDVSRDIVRGSVVRRENAASSLAFTLSNKEFRYTGKFHRMDRVILYLKRTNWIQVFSGYLDLVPHIQLYPGTVDFRATCTLKRLMHTWWDPGLSASSGIFDQISISDSEQEAGYQGRDAGLGSMLRRLLHEVGGWPHENIWIQAFPDKFLNFAFDNLNKNKRQNEEAVEAFKKMILGSDTSDGPGAFAGYNYAAQVGAYAGVPTGGLSDATGIPIQLPGGIPGSGAMTGTYQREVVVACDLKGMGPIKMDTSPAQGFAAAAAKSGDRDDQAAWKEAELVSLNWEEQGKVNDAAIIAFMVVHVESNWLMYANRADPESLSFPYDAIGNDHTSTGLFQQQKWWGHISQRMNARASAMMFYEALDKIQWRNMPRGEAAWRVQQPAEQYRMRYAAYEQVSIQEVKAIRQAMGQNQIPLSPLGLSGGTTSAIMGNSFGTSLTGPTGPASITPGVTSTNSLLGKPSPDSEGAINWGMTQLGTPYLWGGGHGSVGGPGIGLDCSGFVGLAFRAIGVEVLSVTYTMATMGESVPPAQAQRGDVMFPPGLGHVVIYLGGGQYIHSGGSGSVQFGTLSPGELAGYTVRRFCANGGPDPTAPFTEPSLRGPGMPPNTGTGGGGTGGNTRDAVSSWEPIARNLFTYQFNTGQFQNEISELFKGEKAYINDQPLIDMVSRFARAGLRHFASAPNGDFVAYYPDYFGLDGKDAVWDIEDIEMKDVTINYCDDNLATHVYVLGQVGDYSFDQGIDTLGWLRSAGVATVEDPLLFSRLILASPGAPEALTGLEMMRIYGVRPFSQEIAAITGPAMEFLMAVQLFMQKWAEQYSSSVQLCFMPELFPGMRVNLVGHNLQCYVSQVTHSWDWESGFSTSCVFMAPSSKSGVESIYGQQNTENTKTRFQDDKSIDYRYVPVEVPEPGAD